MLIFGLDVGITGGIAALAEDGSYIDCHDLPIMVHGKGKWVDGVELLKMVRDMRKGEPARAMVERIHAMPSMGAVANNSKGMTLGSTLATLQIAGCAIELVEPGTWKRALGMLAPNTSDREKKHASLCRARQLFPMAPLTRIGDSGRAEALLIAHYTQRFRQGEVQPRQQELVA
jgi:hypothetical protein